ncbi:MAG TPA: hypothetical protein VHO48_01810 [Anaerolineaceae bacterium]|nr:hypothetical protein [Anaerolineaceae bacterium]
MKKTLLIVLVSTLILAGIGLSSQIIPRVHGQEEQDEIETIQPAVETTVTVAENTPIDESTQPATQADNLADYRNATYEIEGSAVTLVDGTAETEAAPGSAMKNTTRVFGNEAFGDLNGDGVEDVAFLLTRDNGGSGTFFYAAVALGTEDGYTGTNAIFLGDRIAPQTTLIEDGVIVVNYAERGPEDSFTDQPSVGVSKYLHVVDNELSETDSPVSNP